MTGKTTLEVAIERGLIRSYETNPERIREIVHDKSNLEEWKKVERAVKNAEESFMCYGLGIAQKASQQVIKEHSMTNTDWEIMKRMARIGAALETIDKAFERAKEDYKELRRAIELQKVEQQEDEE